MFGASLQAAQLCGTCLVRENAQVRGARPRFVRTLVAEQRVPFLKIGKSVRFDIDDLDACSTPVGSTSADDE